MLKFKGSKRGERGFTLIELLVGREFATVYREGCYKRTICKPLLAQVL